MFTSLFKLFLQIILLRKGPQDVPYSRNLLLILFVCVISLRILALFIPAEGIAVIPATDRLLFVLTSMLISIGGVYVLLRIFHYEARAVQTITAMLGVTLMFIAVGQVVIVLAVIVGGIPDLTTTLIMIILIWSLVIDAHILRQALSISLIIAGMLAYSFFLAELALMKYFGLMGS